MNIEELKKLQLKIIEKDKKCTRIAKMIFVLILMIAISIMVFLKMPLLVLIESLAFVSVFSAMIIFIVTMIIKEKINGNDVNLFYKNFKNTIVLNSLQNKFTNLTYDYQKGFSIDFIHKIGMLNTADRYSSNDYIFGTYQNISFEQSDVHIEEEYEVEDKDGNKETKYRTIFMGRVMIFDFHKRFQHNIQLSTRDFAADTIPFKKNFKNITLDDDEFNKIYFVRTEDEVDAYALLSPTYMNKMKELAIKVGEPIMICFIDDKLHIAVNNSEDAYEWNVFDVIDEKKLEERLEKNNNLIIDFIKEINSEQGLFK